MRIASSEDRLLQGGATRIGTRSGLDTDRHIVDTAHVGLLGILAAMLSMPARVLAAADVYHALTERRPHRPAYPPDAAAELLRAEARAGRLDPDAVNATLVAAGHVVQAARRDWPAGLSEREVAVVRLAAQGRSNREMAKQLCIAEKTVGHHMQHIYHKIGVSTRAAATLFALQHDLVATSPSAPQ